MPSGPMAHSTKSDDKKLQAQQRHERLAAALRANLLRRKEQARGRAQHGAAEGDPSGAPEGAPGPEMPAAREAPAGPKGEIA